MTVAYDGAGFHGFAANSGVKTVGGTLARSLERILGHPVVLACAGRTDTGVHAWGQVVSFDAVSRRGASAPDPMSRRGASAPDPMSRRGASAPDPMSRRGEPDLDLAAVQRALNKLCGPSIAVREIAQAPPDFDARFSATARVYRYTILNRLAPDPFLAATSWHIESPFDLDVLRLTSDPFIGEHDFSTYCRRPKRGGGGPDSEEVSLVRRVRRAEWSEVDEGVLRFEMEANAFCHQMIRGIVGSMVEVGFGRRRAGDLRADLASRDRSRCGQLAPPHGLCLWQVLYD
jgi:tRNA pseudouridine38-40 synthase